MQTRDFVSIQDVFDPIHCAISNVNEKRVNVYNIASGKSISIKDLANLMIINSGKNLEVVYKQPKKGEIRFSHADISLARKELGYLPKIELEEGIKSLMNIQN